LLLLSPGIADAQYELQHTPHGQSRSETTRKVFREMELEGVDLRQPMLYGYFFYDKDRRKLESLEAALLKMEYKLVRLDPVSDTEFILHVEKIEVHSPESLIRRESEFNKLASAHGVRVYDGWDIGNADPGKPIVSNEAHDAAVKRLTTAEIFELANYVYDARNVKKAAPLFEMCIERKYKLDTCYYRLGVCMVEQDEFVKGIELFERCISINPRYTKAYYNIGATCYDNMQFEKSASYYEKASALDPNDDTIYYGIAASQYALGKYAEARANCEKALSLNSKNEYARVLLGRMPS
jgi:hypothetical protein